MKKKLFAVLAVVLLSSFVISLPVFAAQTVGNGSIPKGTELYIEGIKADGTDPYLEAQGFIGISTEEELKTATGNLYLKNDIVFTSGIGNARSDMVLVGNGHTVLFEGGISIFRKANNVTVRDLNMSGAVVLNGGEYGEESPINYGPLAIAVSGHSVIRNVQSSVNITINDKDFSGDIGGIIGRATSVSYVYEQLSYTGSINTGTSVAASVDFAPINVGGIAGSVGYGSKIKNLHVNAEIVVGNEYVSAVGGVFGKCGSASSMELCSFKGSITVSGKVRFDCGVGGIFGFLGTYPNLKGMINEGDIKAEQEASAATAGGIVGVLQTGASSNSHITLQKLVNRGSISGFDVAGGIVGTYNYASESLLLYMTLLKNEGAVTANSVAGGILGEYATNVKTTIDIYQVYNAGDISVTDTDAKIAGGIVGFTASEVNKVSLRVEANEVYNTGDLTGKKVAPIMCRYAYSSLGLTNDVYYTNSIVTTTGGSQGQCVSPGFINNKVGKLSFEYIDTSELDAIIKEFRKLNSQNYTNASWKEALALVNWAEGILAYPSSQQAVSDAIANVENAINSLEMLSLPDDELEKYNNLIKSCEALNQEDYSIESWENFSEALAIAKRSQTASDMREAYKMLLDAKERLEYIATETTVPPLLSTTPSADTDWGEAWSNFLAQQSGSMPPFFTDDLGFTTGNNSSFDLGAVLGIGGVILFAVAAVGVGIIFGNKDD